MINILYLHIPTLDPGKHQAVMTMVSMFFCDKKSDSDKHQLSNVLTKCIFLLTLKQVVYLGVCSIMFLQESFLYL